MKRQFFSLLHLPEDEGVYGVSFPDFPGCITSGDTPEEALGNAVDALELHLEGMVEDGEEIPLHSDLAEAKSCQKECDLSSALSLIEVNVPESKSVRVNVTFPADILAKIDRAARKSHKTRARFLLDAAVASINKTEQVLYVAESESLAALPMTIHEESPDQS